MKSTDRVRYNYYSIDFACVSIEFITKSQCMDGKWIAFGHSEGSSYFTSDIDYMLCNPDNISQDGFAIFAANLVDGQYKVPFVSLMFGNVISELQNGFLAFVNLQPTYWIYDLPARRARINEKEITVKGIERKKKQKVVFPIGQDDINPNGIIKTFVGNGQINKLSVNLSSRSAEAELKFNTEEI